MVPMVIGEMQLPVKVTSGAYWKRLPDTIAYTATIPVTYRTKWYKPVKMEEADRTEHCKKGTVTCFYRDDLDDLSLLYGKEWRAMESALNPDFWVPKIPTISFRDDEAREEAEMETTGRAKRGLFDFVGSALSWCCGVATERKLDSLATNSRELERILERIDSGLKRNLQTISEGSSVFHEYSEGARATFKQIQQRLNALNNQFHQHLGMINQTENDMKYDLIHVYHYLFRSVRREINSARALNQYTVLNECKDHKIPATIISSEVLVDHLDTLADELIKDQHRLAIPIEDISRYYKIPICDCTFVEDDIIIHIKVPIVQEDHSWELLELITTPFAWKNETCIIMHDPLYLAVSNVITSKSKEMRPITGSTTHNCRPYHDKLCFLPRFSSDVTFGPQCAYKMYLGTTVEELSRLCTFRCQLSTSMVISEIDEDKYIVTNPERDISIDCPGKNTPLPASAYGQPGALQLTIPCNCVMKQLTTGVIIPKRFPCAEELKEFDAIHILPATWTHLRSLIIKPYQAETSPIYNNFSECLNPNWTLTIPHLNLTSPTEWSTINNELSRAVDAAISYGDTFAYHTDIFMIIWNVVLSGVVLFLFMKYLGIPLSYKPVFSQLVEDHRTEPYTAAYVLLGVFIGLQTLCIIWMVIRYKVIEKLRKRFTPEPQRMSELLAKHILAYKKGYSNSLEEEENGENEAKKVYPGPIAYKVNELHNDSEEDEDPDVIRYPKDAEVKKVEIPDGKKLHFTVGTKSE